MQTDFHHGLLGFGELVVVNLYAWRSTLPRDLFAAEQRGIDIVGPDNDRWIIAICRAADLILAAWGNGGQTARASEVVRLLRGHCAETTIVRLGRLTSAGWLSAAPTLCALQHPSTGDQRPCWTDPRIAAIYHDLWCWISGLKVRYTGI